MSRRDRRGQSTVEFALIVPLVMVVLLAVVQIAVVAYSQLAVTHLAREVARALVVDPSADIDQIVASRAPLGTDNLEISVLFDTVPENNLDIITVVISYQNAPVFALFRPFSKLFEVRAEMKMLVEP